MERKRTPAARSAMLSWGLGLALGGCGAKTGLLVPDVLEPPEVSLRDVPDAADRAPAACMPGVFPLAPRTVDMLLVVDRSGSMGRDLGGGGGVSKWSLLGGALGRSLQTLEPQVRVGALFFPEVDAASREASCSMPMVPAVDVEPASGAAPRVLAVFQATEPGGSTPTNAALLRAYSWLTRHPSPSAARFLVLATDGGPNCNPSLDPATCVCVTGGGAGCRGSDANRCLDDVRTVRTLRQLASNPVSAIPTYVIGLSGDNHPAFAPTLEAMAVAGGRPRVDPAGRRTFYDVRRPEELAAALTSIQGALSRCVFALPTRVPRGDGVTVTVGGAAVARDPSRAVGWDWTDRAAGELTLFGAACAPSGPRPAVTATVVCDVGP